MVGRIRWQSYGARADLCSDASSPSIHGETDRFASVPSAQLPALLVVNAEGLCLTKQKTASNFTYITCT